MFTRHRIKSQAIISDAKVNALTPLKNDQYAIALYKEKLVIVKGTES
jgi:hypothetical protein